MDGDTPRDSSEHANQGSQGPDSFLAHSSETDLRPPSLPDLEKLPPKPEEDPDLITWDGLNDPENPASWSFKRKLFVSGVLVSLPLIVNVGTSILSAAGVFLDKEYHVGSEVTVLTTSLFLMGYTFGPLIFGPLSEKIGRRYPIVIGVILFATFCLPVALAQNLYTIMICRFFSGAFGSSSMAVTGGALTDVWPTAVSRGIGMDVFIATGFIGPVIGPIAGNFITYSHLGWRWTMWITAIFAYTFGIFAFFALPETYAPVLLKAKAERVRHETKNWAIHSKLDEDRTDFVSFAKVYLIRPWILLTTEPILVLITLYQSFLYGMLFLFFEGFPISFVQDRHWTPRQASLAFIPLFIGVILGLIATITNALTTFARQTASTPGKIVPERRLPPMIIGAIVLPCGLFWFAWTSHPSTPWPAQVVGAIPISGAMFVIFIQGLKYIIDVYLLYANSAISSNTFVRSFFGAGFPLFGTAMYHRLGVDWATSLLGFLSIALAPVPIVFWVYGRRIRGLSRSSMNKTEGWGGVNERGIEKKR